MRLSYLLNDLYAILPSMDCNITGLSLDSRYINQNDLFFALKGSEMDGHQFINEAIKRGARAILSEVHSPSPIIFSNDIPIIPIVNLRKMSSKLAARFYDYPATKLHMIGVTGTSGKTSCTHFIAQMLQQLGSPCGLIGTLGSGLYPMLGQAGLTTPDSLTLQKIFAEFVKQNADAVAMEVSSHSIEQGRIDDIPFDIRVFTNLSQDHLDYHGDMATYAKVKYRFLAESSASQLIINADDFYGRKWIHELAPHKSLFAVSTHSDISIPFDVPYLFCDHVELSGQGIHAQVHSPWGSGELIAPLMGRFNLNNLLVTIAVLSFYGISFDVILNELRKIKPVAGRMQTIGGMKKPLIVVDYAHKPDALEKVLQALRAQVTGNLICVFGCGGERDRSKRPLMGKIAEELADHVIITNDNPRRENPNDIIAEILQGVAYPDRIQVEPDRSKAIEKSIQCASTNDCVLIAGKGAERYQQIGENKIPFDDMEHALNYLNSCWRD